MKGYLEICLLMGLYRTIRYCLEVSMISLDTHDILWREAFNCMPSPMAKAWRNCCERM